MLAPHLLGRDIPFDFDAVAKLAWTPGALGNMSLTSNFIECDSRRDAYIEGTHSARHHRDLEMKIARPVNMLIHQEVERLFKKLAILRFGAEK